MENKHPIKCQSREQFVTCPSDYWSVAKKTGNLYVRDFDATYTIVGFPPEFGPDGCDFQPPSYRVVVVGRGGVRKDVGPFVSREQLFDALWPEGAEGPVSP